MNKTTLVATIAGLTLALAAMPLAGCSSSPASDSSSTSATSQGTTSSSSSVDDTTEFTIEESEITEAYMGTDEAGEGVYWIGNDDGSKAGLFILSTSGDYVSFLGSAEVDGSIVTITDAVTGDACAVDVSSNSDGTLTFTGAIATTSGATTNFNATVAPCDASEAFDIVSQISEYANLIE